MANTGYRDTTDIILDLLKENLGKGYIKQYFDGDPVWLPVSYLPAIAVVKTKSQTIAGATGTEDLTETIQIRVIFSLMDTMGKSQNVETTHKLLKELIEKRGTTNQYMPKTILGILRTNFTLYNNIVGQSVDIEYEILSGGRITNRKGVLTEEAHITFTIKRIIYVPNRT
jgi:hypothetical protein